ncbi:MAG: polysaccharide-degrading enzyme [Acidobacteria bacterium]|nr:MAG: polysaccharide-degrading enzyme [Acidobacteriota bacterium]
MAMRPSIPLAGLLAVSLAAGARTAHAFTYEVGPGKTYANVGDVPWESLAAGDTVLIYYRATAYKEKFVLARVGTPSAPITVRGVPGPNGELPILDGNGATTRAQLDYYSRSRGVIKIGGSTVPFADGITVMPQWITIESLDIRSARPPYSFTGPSGAVESYPNNASTIYLEFGENITVRNCVLHDSGNGFFSFSSDTVASRNILVEGNYIYDNCNDGSIFEHNVYTESLGITFQYNHLGPLRAAAGGNNLKDRSAGLVVRYNWIEGGNRQLDLVHAEDSSNSGNNDIVLYGGDGGSANKYRKGTLYFYNNTFVSDRTDRTRLFRLSTNDEACDARNNIAYVTASGDNLVVLDNYGRLTLTKNWFKTGWTRSSVNRPKGTITDNGTLTGSSPGFVSEAGQDYHLASGSACIDTGTSLNIAVLPDNDVVREYVKHQSSTARAAHGPLDLGAYEF